MSQPLIIDFMQTYGLWIVCAVFIAFIIPSIFRSFKNKPMWMFLESNCAKPKFRSMSVLVKYQGFEGYYFEIFVDYNKTVEKSGRGKSFGGVLLYCEYYFKHGEFPRNSNLIAKATSFLRRDSKLDDKMLDVWAIARAKIKDFNKNGECWGSPCIELSYFRNEDE